MTKGYKSFKYDAIFKGFISLADITTGKINVFDMLELFEQCKLYNKGEKFLRENSGGENA